MKPRVLTASDLRSGEVVFCTGISWSPDIADASVAGTEVEVKVLDAYGVHSVDSNKIVDPYWIEVEQGLQGIVPVQFRERLRTLGPSIRPDLGKQAGKRNHNVSL